MKKRIFALLMSVCMLISMMPVSSIASDHVHDASCGYVEAHACDHTHNTECGYAEAVEGSACGHDCSDGTCAYAEAVAAQECQHIHGDCSFVAAVAGQPCGHTHGDCSYREAVSGSPCNHAHDGSCGYAEAVAGTSCGHNCASDGCPVNEDGSYACQHSAHDNSCGYSEGTPGSACGHSCESGGSCGYVAAAEGVACDHVCENGGSCGFVAAVDGVDCDHSHNDACGYAAAKDAVPCDHACVSGGACGFVQAIPASDCIHHCDDGTCSYSEGSECTYVEPLVDESEHVHDFAGSWTVNADSHWHTCVEHINGIPCNEKGDLAAHNWDSQYTITCFTCYYSQPHTHTGGTATCDRQATCQLCGFLYGDYDPNVHTRGYHQPIDANSHKVLCDCGATYIESEPHSMWEAADKTYCFYCEYEETTAHTHTWEWTYDISLHWQVCGDPDCGESSTAAQAHQFDSDSDATCDTCGYTRKIEPAHVHSYTAATCTTPATCSDPTCGETKGDVDKSNHVGGTEIRNAKDATEFTEGYTGDTYCKGCGDKLSSGSTIPATHVHSYAAATCTTPATCSCNATQGDVDKSNHVGGTEIRNQVDAGEFTEGYTGDTYCKGCGDKLADGQTIPAAHTHSYTAVVTAPTCSEQGYTTYTCSCNYSYVGNYVNALDHDWGDWTSNGDGTHTRTCALDSTHTDTADCAAFTYANVEGQTYHNIQCECMYVLSTEAHTMGEWFRDGENDSRQCTKNCDYFEEREHIHDWSNYTSNGNSMHTRECTAKGCTAQQNEGCKGGTATCHELAICSGCGDPYGSKNPYNHSGGTEVRGAKDATETENGYTGDTYCLGCGIKISEGDTIPATGGENDDDDTHTHNYSYYKYDGTNHWKMCNCGQAQAGSVKAHTLMLNGNNNGHWKECTICNYYSDIQDHVYSNDSDASCNDCGYERHIHDASIPATCSSPAKCSCGATTGDKDPSNHTGGTEIRNAKEATETENGYTGDTYCRGCGAKLASGKRTNKLGFVDVKYDDDVVVKEVTFQPIKGVTLPDDAEVIVEDHTTTIEPVAAIVGSDDKIEYITVPDSDIYVSEPPVVLNGVTYYMDEIIMIDGEEFLVMDTDSHMLNLIRLSDSVQFNYEGAHISRPDMPKMKAELRENQKVNINGVIYDVVAVRDGFSSLDIYSLYYKGIPAGKYRSEAGTAVFQVGFDPATLKAQRDDIYLGRVTADNTAVVDLTPGKTYNAYVVGANDIHLEGAENVGGTVTQTFEIPAEFVGNENVKYVAVHYTNPYAEALAEAEAAVYYTARTGVVAGKNPSPRNASPISLYDWGLTQLSENGKTLTATYEVDGFSPFIVYAFVEADEPEIKEFVTQPDGTLARVVNGQPVTTHTVASGENLTVIARKYGCTVDEIVALNSDLIENPRLIFAGWVLTIPAR